MRHALNKLQAHTDVGVCCSHTAREPQEQVAQKSVMTCAELTGTYTCRYSRLTRRVTQTCQGREDIVQRWRETLMTQECWADVEECSQVWVAAPDGVWTPPCPPVPHTLQAILKHLWWWESHAVHCACEKTPDLILKGAYEKETSALFV